jgi:hypothetical protein
MPLAQCQSSHGSAGIGFVRETESPTMAIVRRVHKDMKAGVSVHRSTAIDELLSFMTEEPLTSCYTRQRRRRPASNGKLRK